jgi:hypothetical protein
VAELLEHRQVISRRPVFHNPPITQAKAVHLRRREVRAGGGKRRPTAER